MFYSETLQKSSSAPGAARELLHHVRDDVSDEVFGNARLLISEVVSNAVEHVDEDGEIEVRVAVRDDVLRIEVLDPGPGFTPVPRPPGASRESGWGLHFAELISKRWGVDRDGRARVWFELSTVTRV